MGLTDGSCGGSLGSAFPDNPQEALWEARTHKSVSGRADLIVRTAIIVTTTLAIIGLVWFLIQIGEILLMVLIATILATCLSPLVTVVQGMRWSKRQVSLSRPWALFLVYMAVLGVIGLIVGMVVTPLVIETEGFIANLPDNLARIEAWLAGLQASYTWLPDLAGYVRGIPQEFGRLSAYFGPAADVAFRFLGGLATVITVLFLSFYMLVQGPTIKAGLLDLVPRASRPQVAHVFEHVSLKFGGWLRGQLLLNAIIGVAAAGGMAAIGMPYAILLGIYAFLVEFIPLIGPTLSAVPAIFLALFQPPWKIVATIIWYSVIQQVEGNILVPRVMRRAVGLSPLLTILAVIIGAKMLGIVGALIAVPVAAALQVVATEILAMVRPKS